MSYGVNAPQGLQPSQYLNGSPWSGQTSSYSIASGYATSLFSGDPVYIANDGTIIKAVAGNGNPIMGVFYGVKYVDTTGTSQTLPYWLAGTVTQNALVAEAAVVDDPNVLYDIQSTTTHGTGVLVQADLNSTYSIVLGAGSTRTGQSGASLGATDNNAGSQLRLIRFTPNPTNLTAIANGAAFTNGLVLINNDPYKGGVGTAGV